MQPTAWLIKNRAVEQMTWHPGFPMLIKDRLAVEGGWVYRKGTTSFNMYRPPQLKLGDAAQATTWIDHIKTVYNEDDATHIMRWLAQCVQQPGVKINHALVLGGAQGIGKDTLLKPVKEAVGLSNFKEISPLQLLEAFNDFARTVILQIDEARDLGAIDRFAFYHRSKSYITTPPNTMRVNEKHLPAFYIWKCLGLLITTNHLTDGIYLPEDDRRHYVAWSERTKEDFTADYWNRIHQWYENGGYGQWSPICSSWICPALTPTPRRQRRRLSGPSSTPAAHPNTANWPICSTPWTTQKP
jgi:hypothetical protein